MSKAAKEGRPKKPADKPPAEVPPGYLPIADPPRKNAVLLIASGLLLAAWLLVLGYLAFAQG